MPENINVYNGDPTAGAVDGTLVSAENPIADGDLQVGQDREGTAIKLGIRTITDKERLGAFPVQLYGTHADKWCLAPDNNGEPGAFGAWGATLNLSGPMTALNTIIWAKPKVSGLEVIPDGELTYEDLSVSLRIPTDVTDTVFVDTLPEFLTGPTATAGNTQIALAATWGDGGDGESVTAKYILKTVNSTPEAGDWDAAAAFDGAETVTGLTNETPYYAWVRLEDLSANAVVSEMATATPTAVNQPPVFNSGPTVGTIQKTSVVITSTFSDPDEDAITALYRIVARGVTPNWTGAPAFTSPQTASGLTEGTQYDAYVRLDDGQGHVVVCTARQFTTAANVAPTFSTGSTVSEIDQTACKVTAVGTDADSDTLTYKIAVTTSATPPADWSGYADKTHAQMIAGVAVTGLTAATNYYAHIRVDDGHSHLAYSSSAQFTTRVATISSQVSSTLIASVGGLSAKSAVRGTDGKIYVGFHRVNNGAINNPWIAVSEDNGQTWSEYNLRDDATYNGFNVALAAGPSGKVYATFVGKSASSGSAYHIFFGESTDGGATWSGFATATVAESVQQTAASIALDSSGNVHMSAATVDNTICYWKRTGTSWGSKETVSTNSATAGTWKPIVAIGPSGDVHCLYLMHTGTVFQLCHEKRGASAWDATPVVLDTDVGVNFANPSLAIGQNGDVHCVWDTGATTQVIKYSVSTDDGSSFCTPITVGEESTYAQRFGSVCAGSDGTVVVAWSGTHAGSTTNSQISRRVCDFAKDPSDLDNWNAVERVTTDTGVASSGPMAIHALWPQTTSKAHGIPKYGAAIYWQTGALGNRYPHYRSTAGWQQ